MRPSHSVAMEASVLGAFDTIIDARSPAEYAEDHIPGAVSAPVLGDEERARVGALYKQVSPFEAKKLGAALVARNVARHIEELFFAQPRTWQPLVYCWRGGKRSGAMAHILREVGWDARTLEGGYKAYRRWVVETLGAQPARFALRVVHGATGSGKSRLLAALARAGAQVLDLEQLAAHRGSVLGGLPHRPQPSQKWFESQLAAALLAFDPARPVFVEGESRRIGALQVPDALIERMRAAECLRVELPAEARVSLLLEEYEHYLADMPALEEQLQCLAPLHGTQRIGEWRALARRGEWRAFVARLLAEHYDPAYARSAARNFERLPHASVVRVDSHLPLAFEAAARELLERRQNFRARAPLSA